jgi:hypothetical protein
MSDFLRRLVSWVKELLGFNKVNRKSSDNLSVSQRKIDLTKKSSNRNDQARSSNSNGLKEEPLLASSKLRRLVYQAFYNLNRRDNWIELGPLGNALKQEDSSFSIQDYGFSRLSDLLESIPDLVDFERDNNRARLKEPTDIRELLRQASRKISSDNDWVHFSSLKQQISQLSPSFSLPRYGFSKFKEFIESCSDLMDTKREDSFYPPQYYTRLRETTTRVQSRPKLTRPQTSDLPKKKVITIRSRSNSIVTLKGYAFLPYENEKYRHLAEDLALPERWFYGEEPPGDFRYPILKSYLNFTFIRLQYEGKISTSDNGNFSSFNTGLVDSKYEPIYAFFGRDQQGREQDWYLIDFCIPGEGQEGKNLVKNFDGLPKSAQYLDRPEDMFYDIHAGPPEVDWRHILQDNPDRLPVEFLRAYGPQGFEVQEVQGMSSSEKRKYKQRFFDALSADPQSYRTIVSQCKSALEIALLKTQLNYRTAGPYYYPRENRLQLLLPLSLMGNNQVDCALAVDRESSSSYIGHTILLLSWAYNNARLICRPEEHWLSPQLAAGTLETEDDEAEDLED